MDTFFSQLTMLSESSDLVLFSLAVPIMREGSGKKAAGDERERGLHVRHSL